MNQLSHTVSKLRTVWDHFWFDAFDPLSVSLFRICLGALVVVHFLALFPNWERFYEANGILSLNVVDPTRVHQDRQSLFYWTEGIIPVKGYWYLGLVSAVTFTVGWNTRISSIILYLIQISMIHRNVWVVNGEDLTFRMLLFYCCFAPLNRELALDSYLKRMRTISSQPAKLPRIWAVRMMQINILLIYVISLPNKLMDDVAWWDGTAIYWALMNDMWSRWPWPSLFYWSFPNRLLTYGSILVEGLFPILVWFPKTKLYSIIAIASFHLGIAVCLQNVTFFSLAMVCSFWVFVPSASVRSAARSFIRPIRELLPTASEA